MGPSSAVVFAVSRVNALIRERAGDTFATAIFWQESVRLCGRSVFQV